MVYSYQNITKALLINKTVHKQYTITLTSLYKEHKRVEQKQLEQEIGGLFSFLYQYKVSVYLSSRAAHRVLDSYFTKAAIAVRQTRHRKVRRLVAYL